MSGVAHPETMRSARFMLDRAADGLAAAEARRVWTTPQQLRLSAGQHQAGTCRMGSDPAASVTDRHGRVWGHDNLFVNDAALHPTNGGFNPVLTVMALAFRNGEHMAGAL
jgi:choline dehydrogenase-like flavoprotein